MKRQCPSVTATLGGPYRQSSERIGRTWVPNVGSVNRRRRSSAVVRDEGRDAVYVVEDGRAQRVEVVVGAQGDEMVEVRSGLSGGESVVVRDADRLSDGQAVRA